MSYKQVSAVFHGVIELFYKLDLCLPVKIYHYVPAEYYVKFLFKRKCSVHEVELPENNLLFQLRIYIVFSVIKFLKIVKSPPRRQRVSKGCP